MVSSGAFPSLCDLDRAIQRELATLATIEADHCSACRWLDEWSAPAGVKEGLACRLEARHRTEREAHVLRLADLHQQRTLLVIAETLEFTDEVSGGSGVGQDGSKLPPVWMISSPDQGQAGSTITAQSRGSVRTSSQDRP